MDILKPWFQKSSSPVKVFHGAQEALRLLSKEHGITVNNFADTQELAKHKGFGEQATLTSLISSCCPVERQVLNELNRFERKDPHLNWLKRPLNQGMIIKARRSSHYLLRVYSILTSEDRFSSNVTNKIRINKDTNKSISDNSTELNTRATRAPLDDTKSNKLVQAVMSMISHSRQISQLASNKKDKSS